MTLVHGNLPPVRQRADDGSHLQRRLLQDLERQWLDSWGVADQQQSQAAAPPAAPAEEAPPDAGLPPTALAQGTAAAPTPGLAAAPAARHTAAASASKPQALAAAPTRTPPAAPVGQPALPTATREAASPGAGAPSAAAPVEGAASSAAPRDASAPGLDTVTPLPPAPTEPGATAGLTLAPGVGAPATPMATANTVDASPAQVEAAVPRAKLGTGPTLPGAQAQPPAAEGDAAEVPPPAASPRTPPRSPEAEPGPRHFMLRELTDDQVLATMRDADLGSAQSQLAAEGLARALMEAGYARVQVVVNGQRQERGATAHTIPSASGTRRSADAEPLTPLTPQESRHGH